jgi:mono/diheme cytochrome c family protein
MLQNFERGGFLFMRHWFIALLFFAVAITASAQSKSSNSSQLGRGKYLVEQVGMCGDCHSPRNERGQFVKEQWLAGSPLGFKPTAPIPGWVEVAPGIAGLPGWNEKDAIAFLSTGKGLNGKTTGPPMPEFRFTPNDAAAVVAYLKSLKPQSAPTKSSKKVAGKSGM